MALTETGPAKATFTSDLAGHLQPIERFLQDINQQRVASPIVALWSARVLQDKFRYAEDFDAARLAGILEYGLLSLQTDPLSREHSAGLLDLVAQIKRRLPAHQQVGSVSSFPFAFSIALQSGTAV